MNNISCSQAFNSLSIQACVIVAVVAAVVTMLATPLVRKIALLKGVVDDPSRDDRRIHKVSIPKWGGFSIYFGFMIPIAYLMITANVPSYILGILLAGTLVLISGGLDDIYHFSAKIQALFLLGLGFLVQYFSGPDYTLQIKSLQVFPDVWLNFGWFSWFLTAFYIFMITKTMDTTDGLDGLTAGISGIAAIMLAVIGIMGRDIYLAVCAAAMGGASLGFLRYNFHPAKIFMGTGGSQLLGFVLACISIPASFKAAGGSAGLVPWFIFAVPLFDAFLVIIKRRLAGQPITQGDNRHLHHVLIQRGFSQRQAVVILYSIALVSCILLLLLLHFKTQ